MYFSLVQLWRCSDVKSNKQMHRMIQCYQFLHCAHTKSIVSNQCRHLTCIDSGTSQGVVQVDCEQGDMDSNQEY